MPKDLVDNPAVFPLPVSVPIDGELATGPAFETPYQQLTNRTAYLQAKVDKVGIKRIARAANFTILRALTDMEALDLRWVDEFGLYWYEPGGTGKEEIPWRIKPFSGVGFWRHMQYGLRTKIDNATLFDGAPPLTTPSTVFIDVPGLAVTLADAEVGDIVRISFHGAMGMGGAPASFRLAVVEGAGAAVPLPEASETMITSGPQPRSWHVIKRVGTAGNVTASLQFKSSGGGSMAIVFSPASLVAEIVRP